MLSKVTRTWWGNGERMEMRTSRRAKRDARQEREQE